MIKLAIVGGNIGASALISLLRGDQSIVLAGVFEKNHEAPGAILARKWNIPVFSDIESLAAAKPEPEVSQTSRTNPLGSHIQLSH